MTIELNNTQIDNTALIRKLPEALWQKIFEFAPEQHIMARTSKAWQGYIETLRGSFLDLVSSEPNIGAVLRLNPFKQNPQLSNSEKLALLSQFIYRPRVETPVSFVQSTRKGVDEIFKFACIHDLSRAKKLLELKLVSQQTIDFSFIDAVKSGNYEVSEFLLPFISEEVFLDFRNPLLFSLKFPEIFNLLVKSNQKMTIEFALRDANTSQTKALLQSNRSYNRGFYARAAMNTSSALPGLHETLMISAGLDNLKKVEAILKYSKPSREILQHVRNRIQFFKTYAHLGIERLFQIVAMLVPEYINLDPAPHRDRILSLLDEAIARFSEIGPVFAPDPSFNINPERLVPLPPPRNIEPLPLIPVAPDDLSSWSRFCNRDAAAIFALWIFAIYYSLYMRDRQT